MVIVMNRHTFEITVTNSYHTLKVYCTQQHYKHVTILILGVGVRSLPVVQHLSCAPHLDRLQFSFSHNFVPGAGISSLIQHLKMDFLYK